MQPSRPSERVAPIGPTQIRCDGLVFLLMNSLQNAENCADFTLQLHIHEQKRFQLLQGALLP